jgi:cysteine desulfurase
VKRLYLDHNATCPLRPGAREVLASWLEQPILGNPSSVHADGRLARRWLEDARESLAADLGCGRDELVFTSGGTESNALALASADPACAVLYAPTEHPSITRSLAERGRAIALPLDAEGRVHAASLGECAGVAGRTGAAGLAGGRPAFLSVALANHETGVLQDVAALAEAAHALGAAVHCDASQAFGKLPLAFRDLGVDLMTVSAHKLGGPTGIGALVVRAGYPLAPLLRGGSQESGLRAGTEPAALARAFAAATREAIADLPRALVRWSRWTEALLSTLRNLEPSVQLNSPASGRLANTLNASFPGRSGSALVQRLDLEDVSVSHGSACASGAARPSPVLLAMGLDEDRARAAVRISVGPANDDADIAMFPERLRVALAGVASRATA